MTVTFTNRVVAGKVGRPGERYNIFVCIYVRVIYMF